MAERQSSRLQVDGRHGRRRIDHRTVVEVRRMMKSTGNDADDDDFCSADERASERLQRLQRLQRLHRNRQTVEENQSHY